MTTFNRILTLTETRKRIQQFDEQIKRLESDLESQTKTITLRRANDLVKQLDDYRQKVQAIPLRTLDQQEQKQAALASLQDFQERAEHILSGFEDRSRHASSSSASSLPATIAKRSKKMSENTKNPRARRASLMYSEEHSSSEESDDDEDQPVAKQPTKNSGIRSTMLPAKDSSDSSRETDEDDEEENKHAQQGTQALQGTALGRTGRAQQETSHGIVDGNQFLVLNDWAAEQDGDLSIKKGDLIKVLETRADGWWRAKNTVGLVGMVPKTFLKHFDPHESPPNDHLAIQQPSRRQLKPLTVEPTVHRTQAIQKANWNLPTCLGEALDRDSHLTTSCHLTPRLSESNLAFHDLYWNFADDRLRKRFVRISKLLRFIRIEGMESRQPAQAHLLRIALFDMSKRTGRQIVSNVHTIRATNQNGNWIFTSKADNPIDLFHGSDVLVRSNYQQAEILLVVEASIIEDDSSGHTRETSLGVARFPLLSNLGAVLLTNRTYSEVMTQENIFDRSTPGVPTKFRLVLRVMDVPKDLVHYVDSLPDILILHPPFARLAFYYRRRLAEALVRDKEDSASSELLYDPFLASFPRAFDQPDLLDYCRKTFEHKYKQISKRPEAEQASEFYSYFMLTVFVLIDTATMPSFSAWDPKVIQARRSVMDRHAASVLEHKGNVQFLLSKHFRPINLYLYALDLNGAHAID